mgnify:CR=1 FL=1
MVTGAAAWHRLLEAYYRDDAKWAYVIMFDPSQKAVPDKAWFAYFRFYGPTEGYFNRTYALPDFEEVTN